MALQLVVTPRLLSKLGVGSALTVMPGLFGASSLWLLVHPGLAAASAMKFADNGLQYTLHDTTMQSLYVPFSAATRARTRALLEGAIKPLSLWSRRNAPCSSATRPWMRARCPMSHCLWFSCGRCLFLSSARDISGHSRAGWQDRWRLKCSKSPLSWEPRSAGSCCAHWKPPIRCAP